MSRPSSVSPRPPAPGGGGGGPAPCGPGGGGRAKGLKDIRIDEEVKIAVNIALERFRYGDQRGEVPDRARRLLRLPRSRDPACEGAASGGGGGKTWAPPAPPAHCSRPPRRVGGRRYAGERSLGCAASGGSAGLRRLPGTPEKVGSVGLPPCRRRFFP